METLTRDFLKTLFKKVKKLRLPENLETIDFSNLKYYSWEDRTDNVIYLVYNFKDSLRGIKCECLNLSNRPILGICSFCEKPVKNGDLSLITAKPNKLPKNIEYQTFGLYVCSDYLKCNEGMKSISKLNEYFAAIHNNL